MSKERKGCLDLPEPLHGLSLYTVPTSCLLCCFFCNYFHEGIFKSIFFFTKIFTVALWSCFKNVLCGDGDWKPMAVCMWGRTLLWPASLASEPQCYCDISYPVFKPLTSHPWCFLHTSIQIEIRFNNWTWLTFSPKSTWPLAVGVNGT